MTIHYHINDNETVYKESSQVLIDPQVKLFDIKTIRGG